MLCESHGVSIEHIKANLIESSIFFLGSFVHEKARLEGGLLRLGFIVILKHTHSIFSVVAGVSVQP